MHTYQTKIKLHETDAAGRLFFSNQFKIVHDVYETLLEKNGYNFATLIRGTGFFIPIVQCEAEFKAPLFVGDLIEVQAIVEKVGKTSFTIAYTLYDTAQKIVGTAKTVHVTIDKATEKKIPLPNELRLKLEYLYSSDVD